MATIDNLSDCVQPPHFIILLLEHCREGGTAEKKMGTIRNHSDILTDKWLGNILSIVMDLEYST